MLDQSNQVVWFSKSHKALNLKLEIASNLTKDLKCSSSNSSSSYKYNNLKWLHNQKRISLQSKIGATQPFKLNLLI